MTGTDLRAFLHVLPFITLGLVLVALVLVVVTSVRVRRARRFVRDITAELPPVPVVPGITVCGPRCACRRTGR